MVLATKRTLEAIIMKVEPIRNPKDIKKIKKLLESQGKLRDLAIWVTGINALLRTQDLLALRVGDVDGIAVGERVVLTERKTGKQNVLIINEEIRSALDKYLATRPDRKPEEYLFLSRKYRNQPLSVYAVTHYVQSWCDQIGLKGNYGAHSLRKTWTYQMRQHGVPWEILAKRLNHSSPSVTRHYLSVQDEEVERLLLTRI